MPHKQNYAPAHSSIEVAGPSFTLGMRIPHEHPGENIPDGHVFIQPWPAGPSGGRRDHVIYYQYRHDRARRSLRGIDEQVPKAEKAVAGKVLAGFKGYITSLRACPDDTPVTADFVIGACDRLFQIETSKPQCCHSRGCSASRRGPFLSDVHRQLDS